MASTRSGTQTENHDWNQRVIYESLIHSLPAFSFNLYIRASRLNDDWASISFVQEEEEEEEEEEEGEDDEENENVKENKERIPRRKRQ